MYCKAFQYFVAFAIENIGINPAGDYMFKVNNKDTRTRCEMCSKLTMKTPEQNETTVFIVNFEYISHLFLEFQLFILNKLMLAGCICGKYSCSSILFPLAFCLQAYC